ncbi:aspartate racemase protein [Diplodia corticola]|uniref:Aspartate racemase protein n=1 Tax=Diplodia corticola TaxID=236234 RepID=A0A1J9RVQ5_9PEZI|nr:aspartate racemase protein [Diplodia corticola]OJD31573.1 aspartate racemase protein [Diplodia corticola]
MRSHGGIKLGDREYARRRFGSVMSFLADLIVDVREMRKVEDTLESTDKSVMAFKDSHLSAVGSVSTTAAIVAQLSSTTLQMPGLSHVHWTAPGCIIASLVFGVLAVILGTVQQQILGTLTNPEGVRMWLSNGRFYPPHRLCRPRYDERIGETGDSFCLSAEHNHLASTPQFRGTAPRARRRLQVSIAALQLMSMPHKFLTVAVAFFLGGLALYLGFAYRQDLDDTPARDNNEAVFISFVAVAGAAVMSGLGVSAWKFWEVRGAERRSDKDAYGDEESEAWTEEDEEEEEEGEVSEQSGYDADESQFLSSSQMTGSRQQQQQQPRARKSRGGGRHDEIAEMLEEAARLHKRLAQLMREETNGY